MRLAAFLLMGFLPLAGHSQGRTTAPRQTTPGQLLPGQTALPAPGTAIIPPAEAVRMLADPRHQVLDVRTPQEYAAGNVKGAKNMDYRAPDFEEQLHRLNPNSSYLLYCASGSRSNQAAALMRKKGFKKVVNIGGYNNLKDAGAQ